MKSLVVLPTYNEAENIDKILEKLTKYDFLDILVVDDNSTDGTREKVYKWIKNNPIIHILERPGKLGLGTAYVDGFKWGLKRDYEAFFEMDADLSHNPDDIPRFIEALKNGYDAVIVFLFLYNLKNIFSKNLGM